MLRLKTYFLEFFSYESGTSNAKLYDGFTGFYKIRGMG